MTRDAMLVLRLPQSVKTGLSKASNDQARSMSALAVEVLTEWLGKKGYPVAAAPAPRAKAKKSKK